MNPYEKNPDYSEKHPGLRFNIVPLSSLSLRHVKVVAARFARNEGQPLILGAPAAEHQSNQPVAALIPFEDYVRLLHYDQAAESRFQQGVSDRGRDMAEEQVSALSLEQLESNLGSEITRPPEHRD